MKQNLPTKRPRFWKENHKSVGSKLAVVSKSIRIGSKKYQNIRSQAELEHFITSN
jgi:hypothetical protein